MKRIISADRSLLDAGDSGHRLPATGREPAERISPERPRALRRAWNHLFRTPLRSVLVGLDFFPPFWSPQTGLFDLRGCFACCWNIGAAAGMSCAIERHHNRHAEFAKLVSKAEQTRCSLGALVEWIRRCVAARREYSARRYLVCLQAKSEGEAEAKVLYLLAAIIADAPPFDEADIASAIASVGDFNTEIERMLRG
jgi:hypothetical protein